MGILIRKSGNNIKSRYSDFGRTIRKYRHAIDMTQAELASILGVTPLTISRWELGQRAPGYEFVKPLAEALGIEIAELFGDRWLGRPM